MERIVEIWRTLKEICNLSFFPFELVFNSLYNVQRLVEIPLIQAFSLLGLPNGKGPARFVFVLYF